MASPDAFGSDDDENDLVFEFEFSDAELARLERLATNTQFANAEEFLTAYLNAEATRELMESDPTREQIEESLFEFVQWRCFELRIEVRVALRGIAEEEIALGPDFVPDLKGPMAQKMLNALGEDSFDVVTAYAAEHQLSFWDAIERIAGNRGVDLHAELFGESDTLSFEPPQEWTPESEQEPE